MATAGLKPGVERWTYKTGTDPEAAGIDISTATPAQIADLVALQAPADPDQLTARDAPTETTFYSVSATLTAYKLEADGDYHLVLDDGNGHTMIAEIPDPDFLTGGAWDAQITAARAAFNAQFQLAVAHLHLMLTHPDVGGIPMITRVAVPVTVEGIGFFDRLHGQTGVAPNGIELHPVLSIAFTAPPSG